MPIDNFERFAEYMDCTDHDKFYLINVLQRHKDIPSLDKSTRLLKTYTVTSKDYLEKIKPEIIQLCDVFTARAYVYVNRRSYKNTARHMLKTLADNFTSDSFVGITHLFTSEASAHGIGDKLWILDVDLKDSNENSLDVAGENTGIIRGRLWKTLDYKLLEVMPEGCKLLGYLPTKHGFHFISKPFDTRVVQTLQKTLEDEYRTDYIHPELELKKDAMTNLYIP